jgi:hypothetical protein
LDGRESDRPPKRRLDFEYWSKREQVVLHRLDVLKGTDQTEEVDELNREIVQVRKMIAWCRRMESYPDIRRASDDRPIYAKRAESL